MRWGCAKGRQVKFLNKTVNIIKVKVQESLKMPLSKGVTKGNFEKLNGLAARIVYVIQPFVDKTIKNDLICISEAKDFNKGVEAITETSFAQISRVFLFNTVLDKVKIAKHSYESLKEFAKSFQITCSSKCYIRFVGEVIAKLKSFIDVNISLAKSITLYVRRNTISGKFRLNKVSYNETKSATNRSGLSMIVVKLEGRIPVYNKGEIVQF